MLRTTDKAVEDVLGRDYDTSRTLKPFIDTAASVVDQLVECANDLGITITTTQKELIERWLAAHYYTRSDRTYKSRSTQRSSGEWHGDGKEYLNTACELDPSGCLRGILSGKHATIEWGGKTESEQIDYEDRN